MSDAPVTVDRRAAEPPLVLALDLGTSSVRAVVFDRLGRAVDGAEARAPHALRVDAEGAAESDPDALREAAFRCIDAALAGAGGRVAAVAACTFVHNVLGVDAGGRPVTPLYAYADARAGSDAAALRRELDERAAHDRTGCRFHTCYLPARLRWVARARPGLARPVVRWITIGEYLELALFGESACTFSVASWSGMLDRRRLAWDAPLCAAAGAETDRLSRLTDADTPRRGLRPAFAARWPALRDVPWFPAVGDGVAANLGCGCADPSRVAVTLGTTSAVRAVVPGDPVTVPDGLWCYRVDRRRSLVGGAPAEGGNVFAWMAGTLGLPPEPALEAALAALTPDAHGLTVLPFVTGERSPGWAEDARAAVAGLRASTTAVEIVRAGLEAVACRIALVFGRLRGTLPGEPRVVGGGGALQRSPAWQRILADALGVPLAVTGAAEPSARGAALLALESLGALRLADAPDAAGPPRLPDPAAHAAYRRAAARQQALYDRLIAPPPAPGR
jgi:gluconokinase